MDSVYRRPFKAPRQSSRIASMAASRLSTAAPSAGPPSSPSSSSSMSSTSSSSASSASQTPSTPSPTSSSTLMQLDCTLGAVSAATAMDIVPDHFDTCNSNNPNNPSSTFSNEPSQHQQQEQQQEQEQQSSSPSSSHDDVRDSHAWDNSPRRVLEIPEILRAICEFLGPHDLAQICAVSVLFSYQCKPLLWRHVLDQHWRVGKFCENIEANASHVRSIRCGASTDYDLLLEAKCENLNKISFLTDHGLMETKIKIVQGAQKNIMSMYLKGDSRWLERPQLSTLIGLTKLSILNLTRMSIGAKNLRDLVEGCQGLEFLGLVGVHVSGLSRSSSLSSTTASTATSLTTTSIPSLIKTWNLLTSIRYLKLNELSNWEYHLTDFASRCPNLLELSLARNETLDLDRRDIQVLYQSCPQLYALDTSCCTGMESSTLWGLLNDLENLTAINLSYTKLTDDNLMHLADKCRKVKRLEIRYCTQVTSLGFHRFMTNVSPTLLHLEAAGVSLEAKDFDGQVWSCINLEILFVHVSLFGCAVNAGGQVKEPVMDSVFDKQQANLTNLVTTAATAATADGTTDAVASVVTNEIIVKASGSGSGEDVVMTEAEPTPRPIEDMSVSPPPSQSTNAATIATGTATSTNATTTMTTINTITTTVSTPLLSPTTPQVLSDLAKTTFSWFSSSSSSSSSLSSSLSSTTAFTGSIPQPPQSKEKRKFAYPTSSTDILIPPVIQSTAASRLALSLERKVNRVNLRSGSPSSTIAAWSHTAESVGARSASSSVVDGGLGEDIGIEEEQDGDDDGDDGDEEEEEDDGLSSSGGLGADEDFEIDEFDSRVILQPRLPQGNGGSCSSGSGSSGGSTNGTGIQQDSQDQLMTLRPILSPNQQQQQRQKRARKIAKRLEKQQKAQQQQQQQELEGQESKRLEQEQDDNEQQQQRRLKQETKKRHALEGLNQLSYLGLMGHGQRLGPGTTDPRFGNQWTLKNQDQQSRQVQQQSSQPQLLPSVSHLNLTGLNQHLTVEDLQWLVESFPKLNRIDAVQYGISDDGVEWLKARDPHVVVVRSAK